MSWGSTRAISLPSTLRRSLTCASRSAPRSSAVRVWIDADSQATRPYGPDSHASAPTSGEPARSCLALISASAHSCALSSVPCRISSRYWILSLIGSRAHTVLWPATLARAWSICSVSTVAPLLRQALRAGPLADPPAAATLTRRCPALSATVMTAWAAGACARPPSAIPRTVRQATYCGCMTVLARPRARLAAGDGRGQGERDQLGRIPRDLWEALAADEEARSRY